MCEVEVTLLEELSNIGAGSIGKVLLVPDHHFGDRPEISLSELHPEIDHSEHSPARSADTGSTPEAVHAPSPNYLLATILSA